MLIFMFSQKLDSARKLRTVLCTYKNAIFGMVRSHLIIFLVPFVLLFMTACKTYKVEDYPELAEKVDVGKFMGTWYVHGCTPTFLDRDPHNATETYELGEGGRIQTTYRFRKGSFDGPEKVMRPVGRVVDEESGAEWSMRFFGILSAPYLILYVDPEYDHTLVGHPNREMAWLMSRSPEIDKDTYDELMEKLKVRSYDLESFVRVPQQWPQALE